MDSHRVGLLGGHTLMAMTAPEQQLTLNVPTHRPPRRRTGLVVAAVLVLVALIAVGAVALASGGGEKTAAPAAPSNAPAAAAATASPSPSYDPALAIRIDSQLTSTRTGWDGNGSYVAGKDIRPGWWQTAGGTCSYTAPGTFGVKTPAFTVAGGGWSPADAYVELKSGDTLTIEVETLYAGGHGCWWNWVNGKR